MVDMKEIKLSMTNKKVDNYLIKNNILAIDGVYHVDVLFATSEFIIFLDPKKEPSILEKIYNLN